VPDVLRIGDKTTDVYLGIWKNQDIYVGISKNVSKRMLQHGDRFDVLRKITKQKLTRRQARAIEQAILLRNPQYTNKINSIAKSRPRYKEAVEWGEAWLRANGY
jgi:predicted GIY-YIG superfamily endonuclease